ncbi:MAG: tetratricopeptide repeat protein [bacterium]|nr:tetratricopeptide repeat protein [bacterium]
MNQHEEEQVENLKRFVKDYGTPIVVGVVLALAVFAGWRYWQNDKLDQATRAATIYQDMLSAVERSHVNPQDKAGNTDVQRYAKTLKEDYAKTPYALSAGLLLARQASDRNDFKEAEKQLHWVLEQKPGEGERVLTVTRLARVLAGEKQYEAALALLGKETDAGFRPTIEELKGDIYQAQGKIPEAQKAYQAAAAALQARDERRPLLEMKMADVGLAVPESKKTGAKKALDEESKSS